MKTPSLFPRRMYMFATVVAAMLVALPGCAAFWSALPSVITAVSDASIVVQDIKLAVDHYFDGHPNDAAKKADIDKAMLGLTEALIVVNRLGAAGKDIHDKEMAAAIQEFGKAFQALMLLVKDIGISVAPPGTAAPHGVHVIREPLILHMGLAP